MHKLFLALSVLTLGGLAARAQTTPVIAPAPAAPAVAVTLTPTYVSQYMFRGTRLSGQAFEPSLAASYGNTSLGLWSNFPFDKTVPGQSDPEFDFTGGYTFALSDTLSLVPGFTYYVYPRADANNGFYHGTFEPNLALNYTVAGLTLTPKLYYDVVLQGPTYELNAAYVVPLKALGTELDFNATLGTFRQTDVANHASPSVKNWGDYWLAGVTVPFVVTKESKVLIGWAYTEGRENYLKQGTAPRVANSGAIGRGVLTLSYAWTF